MINNNNVKINLKDSIVETPKILSNHIYNVMKRKPIHNILDIGCYQGNLTSPFKKKKDLKIIGIDVIDTYKDNFDNFIYKDFLDTTKEDYKNLNIDLIISNPPFNKHPKYNELYPMLFLEHSLKLFGKSIPIIIICGSWLLSNSIKRMNILNNIKINKITTIHKNIFGILNKNVSVEASILFINIKTKEPHYFLSIPTKEEKKKEEQQKRIFKSIVFNHDQNIFIKENINNFNKEIKELIKEKYSDFPI